MSINVTKIEKAISDVSSLEVATLTNANDDKFDLSKTSNDDIFTAIRAKLNQSDLVAYTRFELDGDAVNFINNKEEMATLVEEHSIFVDSALETRKALFDTVLNTIKNIIK